MTTNLSDLVMVFDGALHDNVCAKLIHLFESETGQLSVRRQSVNNSGAILAFDEWNIMQTPVVPREMKESLVTTFQQYCREYAHRIGLTANQWPPEGHIGMEQFRMKKYHPGGDQFTHHVDVTDYNNARRFLSFFFYLNTPNGGGETEFYSLDKPIKVTPKQGRLVMFPPLWMFPHAGLPTTHNPKYLLHGYLHYV